MKKGGQEANPMKWWTWLVVVAILFLGSLVSEYFRFIEDVSLFYLPIPLGIILINWWGSRVLFAYYFVTVLCIYLFGYPDLALLPLLAAHQTFTVFLSWKLCKLTKTDVLGLSNSGHFLRYTLLGLFVPILFNSTYAVLFTHSHYTISNILLIWFSDFFTNFAITIPILFFFSPVLSKHKFTAQVIYPSPNTLHSKKSAVVDFVLTIIVFTLATILLDFEKYWFVYGVLAIFVAVRQGFQLVILVTLLSYVFIYLLPFFNVIVQETAMKDIRAASVHFGMTLLCVSATIIGRIISDLRIAKIEQEHINEKLSVTNQELDRFVYSVSHDLSSPLKSIKGLINVIDLEKDTSELPNYLKMIDRSVTRLESFIEEILDYSRSNRAERSIKSIDLPAMINEVIESYAHLPSFERIRFEYDIQPKKINSDPFLLKIVFNNLISNAIKYQRKHQEHNGWIKISAHIQDDQVIITIADNGEGIPPKLQPRIFEMFFRGTNNEPGSGLGLYIAKTAIMRLQGTIDFESTFDSGSVFTIQIPLEN